MPLTKLTPQDVLDIRARWAAGELQRSLAQAYGVNEGHISRVVNGKTQNSSTAVVKLALQKVFNDLG